MNGGVGVPAPVESRAWDQAALFGVAEMAAADRAAVAAGIPGIDLMEAAGGAVAKAVMASWSPRPVAVLCGPGNNGGDGFVAARHMAVAGWPVRVASFGGRDRLTGDAAIAAGRWTGAVADLADVFLDDAPLVIDALFGAGLDRPLAGAALAAVMRINAGRLACVSIDMPSGVAGDSGRVLGAAPQAALTVTFFRRKPGHLLMPGRALAGRVVVADIGIPPGVPRTIQPRQFENHPALWLGRLPRPSPEDNKYDRGHVLIVGGEIMTGAARLAARAARRAGAGLVTIAAPESALSVYAGGDPGVLTLKLPAGGVAELMAERRRCAVLVGPGNGVSDATRRHVQGALSAGKAAVLDADALGAFAGAAHELAGAIRSPTLLTPHEGEFARLFADLPPEMGKLARARQAAKAMGATVLLKGADTVVAEPGGLAVINANAPAGLATGGSGDVLAGIAVGLMAQGMDAFSAGAAAAWLQAAAASRFGAGLIAEDLADALPAVLAAIQR